MHQPDYRNEEGIMQMPWVFLHAIKDYYDMPWMLSRYKNIKATFNITSPLIEQLQLYSLNPEQSDRFLSLWLEKPSSLKEEDRKWLIKICKSSQFETMVKFLPRYAEIFTQEHFTNAELIDLELLFILAWCGNYLKQNNTLVEELIKKERNYTHGDKEALLEELSKFISGIWDFYKKLHAEKRITIATTPFYHPILPLLMDMKNAQKANSMTQIPKEYVSLRDDARLHVQRAKKLFEETFGYEPDGFWPAEGAVDESSVQLLESLGIRWIATDEEILYKSINSRSKDLLYAPYKYHEMTIGFRDHYLSDLIGFKYRYEEAQSAASNFMAELQKIENINDNATVFVILDGENAWEFYKNNGLDFFDALYKGLNDSSWCKTVMMDEVNKMASRELINLAPGSWINGNFDTWVGESEKTRAWELLFLTKRDYEHHKESLTPEIQESITTHFLSAECSDWFWWYGSDHFSAFAREFDELFRNHLISIYELIGITPPGDLFIPIDKERSGSDFWIKPQSKVTAKVDGKRDSFFEWMGCGVVDESKMFSTMQRQSGAIQKIYYGQDEEKLYFAFEGDVSMLCKDGIIHIMIDPLKINAELSFNQKKTVFEGVEIESACNDWLELSIDKTKMQEDEISLRFEIEENAKALQTLPSFGELRIALNDDYSKNWFV
jgi:alpha-amylase/alpha-mannosidase (GH57 family)